MAFNVKPCHKCGWVHHVDCRCPEPRRERSPGWRDGWVCPLCGRGVSPELLVCPCVHDCPSEKDNVK